MGNLRQTIMAPDVNRPILVSGGKDRRAAALGLALAASMREVEPVFRPTQAAPASIVSPMVTEPAYRAERPAPVFSGGSRDRTSFGPKSGPMKPKPKIYKGSKAAKRASRRRA